MYLKAIHEDVERKFLGNVSTNLGVFALQRRLPSVYKFIKTTLRHCPLRAKRAIDEFQA